MIVIFNIVIIKMSSKRVKISKKIFDKATDDPKAFAKNSNIDELVIFLKYCSDKYYNTSEEVVSDDVFDMMMETLAERDPKNTYLNKIGAPVNNKDKVDLPYPMASLDKIKPGSTKFSRWTIKYTGPYVISDKLDGVSAQLIKGKDGKTKLYTRGDATQGKDISHLINVLVNKKILDKLPKETSLRGEIIISRKNYPKLKDKYANGRAAVSGLTGADDGDYNKTVAKYAELVIYGMINPVEDNHYERMKKIKSYGFKTVWMKVLENTDEICDDDCDEENENNRFSLEEELKKYLLDRRVNSEYDVDGIVCVDSSKAYKDQSTNPKHAFAFKMRFEDQTAITTVLDVEWEPTMYAYIQPTVIIKAVKIGGSTIERATGHNAKYINDGNIGKGAKIKIIKSGDVIPYILEIIEPAKEPIMPDIKYKWHENGYEIIASEIKGETAYKIGIKRTLHFFKTLKIKYISEGIITKLYYAGYFSIFKILLADHDELTEIDGIGKPLVKKIFKEIEKKITACKLYTLMAASLKFGRGLGVRKLRVIVNAYPDIMETKVSKEDMWDNVNDLEGFSDITATQFVDNFAEFKDFYKQLSKCVDISHLEIKKNKKNSKVDKKKSKSKTKNKPKTKVDFSEQKIVFTGFRDDNLEEFILDNGGSVSGSVSGNTDIVIYVHKGDDSSKPSKLVKAEKLFNEKGKPLVIAKDDFIKKYQK